MKIYHPVRAVGAALRENSYAVIDDVGVEIGRGGLSHRMLPRMMPDRPLEIEMTMDAHPAARDTLFGALTADAQNIKAAHGNVPARLFVRIPPENNEEIREYYAHMGFDDFDGDELYYFPIANIAGRRRVYYPVTTKSIDVDLRTRVRREEFLQELASFGGEEHASQWLEARMQDPGFVAKAVYAGSDFVGEILVTGTQSEAHIEMILVEPKWRRRGVARALIDECLAELAQAGCAYLTARCPRRNNAATQLFGRSGFTWAGTESVMMGCNL